MPDPAIFDPHGMPSEEFLRYAAFWTDRLRELMFYGIGLAFAFLICLKLFIVRPIEQRVARVESAIEDQSSLLTGGQRAE